MVLLTVLGTLRTWESFERDGRVLLCHLAVALGLEAGALWLPQNGELVARVIWTAPRVENAALEELASGAVGSGCGPRGLCVAASGPG